MITEEWQGIAEQVCGLAKNKKYFVHFYALLDKMIYFT